MCVVGEADDGECAIRLVGELSPDALVMDVSMPLVGGIEAMRRLGREAPGTPVVVLTVHEEPSYLHDMLDAGARGYVLKRSAAVELVRALHSVVEGGRYIDPALSGTLIEGFLDRKPAPFATGEGALSDRERDVLTRIARGYRNVEIADDLHISVKTVETYKARVAEKLGLRSRVDIVRFAARHGWLNGE